MGKRQHLEKEEVACERKDAPTDVPSEGQASDPAGVLIEVTSQPCKKTRFSETERLVVKDEIKQEIDQRDGTTGVTTLVAKEAAVKQEDQEPIELSSEPWSLEAVVELFVTALLQNGS